MTARSGTSVIEALVAAGLAAIALAGLAGTGALVAGTLGLARDGGLALALATARLETLRAGPRADGSDVTTAPPATRFDRDWRVTDGRGQPTALDVNVRWGAHRLSLATEALP